MIMTPEQQRIAIAEACGWKKQMSGQACLGWLSPDHGNLLFDFVPDYLNDLNAMHEAEKVLNPSSHHNMWCEYIKNLSDVTGVVYCINATASQRAEAFLRTMGKWE